MSVRGLRGPQGLSSLYTRSEEGGYGPCVRIQPRMPLPEASPEADTWWGRVPGTPLREQAEPHRTPSISPGAPSPLLPPSPGGGGRSLRVGPSLSVCLAPHLSRPLILLAKGWPVLPPWPNLTVVTPHRPVCPTSRGGDIGFQNHALQPILRMRTTVNSVCILSC